MGDQGASRDAPRRLPARYDGPGNREAGGGGAGAAVAGHHGGRRVPGRREDARGRHALRLRSGRDAPPRAADADRDRSREEHDRRHEHDRRGGYHGRGCFPYRRPRSERGEEGVTFGAARRARVVLLIVLLAALVVAVLPAVRGQGPRVLLAEVTGAIDRSTVDYLQEAVAEARSGGYTALMVRFDTPGGGLAETVAIAEMFNNARDVPILGWVGPVGAHAWSAGTILLVSTDLAAMAPGTTIGSVQPVEVGPGGVVPVTDPKIINAVVTAISEELALHNRPIDLASAFVVDNLNLNATQAQVRGATELVAPSPGEFAASASGRRVIVQSNGTVYKDFTLNTAGAEIVPFSSSSRVSLLRVLSDPLVSSLLLILGIYLVIFGISAPGHGAEIAGVIVLLLALIGLGFSVDPIALLLFIVGVVL